LCNYFCYPNFFCPNYTRKKQNNPLNLVLLHFLYLFNQKTKKSGLQPEKNFKHVSSYNFLKQVKKKVIKFRFRKAVSCTAVFEGVKNYQNFFPREYQGHTWVDRGSWELYFLNFFKNITLTPNAHGQRAVFFNCTTCGLGYPQSPKITHKKIPKKSPLGALYKFISVNNFERKIISKKKV
jgi:hypothetical protein